jgi:hypothetical protein|tara:strand:+ start:44 stop:490 length:447 start_codon:yes stop_codon:yes gene_type:complete
MKMIIFRNIAKSMSKKQKLISGKVAKKLKDGKYNGYAYVQAVKKPLPGHGRIVRIGETGISSDGLTTYRPTRGIREWKQPNMTNKIGEFYKREDIVTFIFPTKIPFAHKILEGIFKQKHIKKHGESPVFDLDNQYKFLVDNDEWTSNV